MRSPLPILYQDDFLVAVNKPSGMLVHKSMIDRREKQVVMTSLRDQLGQWVYPLHRLDRPTSGVLLFALDSSTARMMTESFVARLVKKSYLALVRGRVEEPGVIDQPLAERLDRIADRQANPSKQKQPAITEYIPLATIELPIAISKYPTSCYSLVRLQPQTGRRHQLRRHMHHDGHPIIGDTNYGDGVHNRYFKSNFNSPGLLLCATELTFQHPCTDQALTITAMVEEAFKNIIVQFGWQDTVPEQWLEID